jgi:hypothetical protein
LPLLTATAHCHCSLPLLLAAAVFAACFSLQVHRPLPGAPLPVAVDGQWETPGGEGNDAGDLWQGFASLVFPGFVGVLTGVSQHGIGLSEKVRGITCLVNCDLTSRLA